jgi:hypothetical protein
MHKYFSLPVLALMLGFFLAACAVPQSIVLPSGTLNADQVSALFMNKTVTSVTVASGRESVSYYDPNGDVRQLRKGERRNGVWRITKNGRICLKFDAKEKCRIIVKEEGDYRKYVVKKSGQHRPVVDYKSFKSGNTLGL